jgi:hypothetical protein
MPTRRWKVGFPRLPPQHYIQMYSSFSIVPGNGETDLRTLYCAFCICDMLGDWSGVNIEQALKFIGTCRVNAFALVPAHWLIYHRRTKGVMARHPSVKLRVCSLLYCAVLSNRRRRRTHIYRNCIFAFSASSRRRRTFNSRTTGQVCTLANPQPI